MDYRTYEWPPDAARAVAALDDGYARWTEGHHGAEILLLRDLYRSRS